jgi:hypothetical protein
VRQAALSALLGAFIAVLILWSHAKGDINRTAYGDGLIYRYVASHLDQPKAEVDPVVSSRGTSLRYGRIGLPGAIWLLSAGRATAMPWAQAGLMVFSAAIASAAMSRLMPIGLLAALLPFLAPGFPEALSGGFADGFAAALCVCAVLLCVREHWFWAAMVMAIAILSRENAAVALLGLGAWGFLKRDRRALLLALSLLPTMIWYGIIAARYGHIPILDPYLRVTTQTVGPPFVALFRSLAHPASVGAEIVVCFHIIAATIGIILGRRTIFGLLVATASLQLLISGPFAWQLIGEATRTAVILQVFVVSAIAAWVGRDSLPTTLFLPAGSGHVATPSSMTPHDAVN